MEKTKANKEFEQIALLIEEARNRAFSKVNEELVLLYFNVGNIVADKINTGAWGEKTVDELANYIALKQPELSGFNRRGFYRMKQFFESYAAAACFLLWKDLQTPIVSPAATQL